VDISALRISGAYEIGNRVHSDERGVFVEWFRQDHLRTHTGLNFQTAQANLSVSVQGALRGIHYADVPPGQAKYVTCVSGAILDYVVDIRVGSPTFGEWESISLSSEQRNAVLIDVGLGHAFVALEPNTTVAYLVSDHFKPDSEHAVNPLDPDIGLDFPIASGELSISPKDEAAPSLQQARENGALPIWQGA
jgi:dTDP-4-dehydrorhamnose 3,5-epimerase